jgi:transposase
MARKRFQLTEGQKAELTRAFANCKDGPTRTRFQAVRLYGSGYRVSEILQITGCSRTSLMDWCRYYRTNGVEGLVDKRRGGNNTRLDSVQLEDLRVRLQSHTPAELFGSSAATDDGQFWTVPDLQRAIEQWYGVRYQSAGSYPRLFHVCGFSYQRPAKVYKSRSAAKIADFEEQLEKNSSTLPKMHPRQ